MTAPPSTDHVAYYKATGHCGQCGNPGGYCTCWPNRPCGCKELHPIGSARDPDALAAFRQNPDDAPPVIQPDQQGLF